MVQQTSPIISLNSVVARQSTARLSRGNQAIQADNRHDVQIWRFCGRLRHAKEARGRQMVIIPSDFVSLPGTG